jgi:hypothetical protein
MSRERLIALGISIDYVVVTTAVLSRGDQPLPRVLRRLTSRDALPWNTMVGIAIGAAALRWALTR